MADDVEYLMGQAEKGGLIDKDTLDEALDAWATLNKPESVHLPNAWCDGGTKCPGHGGDE